MHGFNITQSFHDLDDDGETASVGRAGAIFVVQNRGRGTQGYARGRETTNGSIQA